MHLHSTISPEEIVNHPSSTTATNIDQTPPASGQGNTVGDSLLRKLSFLDRFLALWILLAIVVGILLGYFVHDTNDVLEAATLIGVSAPIAVGLIVMMYPILCKVRFEELDLVLKEKGLWKQLAFSFIVNWIIAPLVMLGLAWAFLPDKRDYREGLILVGLARCIAMVLVWNDLAGGNGDYCAILVAFNSILQMVLYAPFAILYINVVSPPQSQFSPVTVSYSIVAKSVGVFLGIPLAGAVVTRLVLRRLLGPVNYTKHFIRYIAPLSLVGLIFTIIILFASQGRNVVNQIILVVRVAAPLVVYFAIIFLTTLWICRRLKMDYGFTSVQSFTAASNNFELAIAVAIATFGANSNQALAATVGPLIEVPVLLGLVYLMRFVKGRWTWGRDEGVSEELEPIEFRRQRIGDVEKVGEGQGVKTETSSAPVTAMAD